MRYMLQKDLGYDRENVMEVPMRNNMISSRETIKNDLLQQPGILNVAFSSLQIQNVQRAAGWKDSLMVAFVDVDKAFIPTLGMELVEGNNFSDSPADSTHFILNETAVKTIGIIDPVGKPFEFLDVQGTIIGVVKDFNFRNLHEKIEPLLFRYTNEIERMYIRLSPGAVQKTVAEIEKTVNRYDPETAFTHTFLDDRIENMYRSDIRTGKLFNLFAIIAIIVSCLGLFGLVTFTAEAKTKEIGIRKVLGASVMQIVKMLLTEFFLLVGVAMLIAFPFAYYWLDGLLQDYAYRIPISGWIFVLAGIITLLLTLITVSWQAVRAATANPVEAIKAE
jgi:putative ABC transport system permease protein